jgi:hypothetical protein
MKLDLNKLKLKQEIDRNEVLVWGSLIFAILGFFYEASRENTWFSFVFASGAVSVYFYFLSRLQRRLYYSFWSFFGILCFYLLYKVLTQPIFSMESVAFISSLILLGIMAYSLWSPIFYPIVSWWEYDFRYRDDLRVKVIANDEKSDGRLTDLRKGAGCIASFKTFKVGDEIEIEPFEDLDSVRFRVEIMSKRKYSLGRPFNYGVRFVLDGGSDNHLFKNFVRFWKNERKLKMKKKFKNESA